ncbi:unnamed protein product [Cuscuta campestris]|uniref:mitogen-activated protein kinase kinase kinase n=1 Tax=Cuscuta campestris TaxID=132261 RepID=A0A484L252_9ASTE|nr:unnamed protein product [Cuscuta campestris]
MHWWRSAFISSATSSSPSSSAKVHSDDSLIVAGGGKQTLKWAFLFGRSRSRSRGRPLDGGANCHHVICQDIGACIPSRESSCENSRAPTSSSVAQPSPLPLPVPDSISNSCSIPLPSPKNLHFNPKDRDVIREKADSNPSPNNDGHGDEALSLHRFLSEAARKNTGHLESLCRRKSHREPKGARRFTDLRIPPPSSAPTSPYASPALSPLNCVGEHLSTNFIPQHSIFQVWSAPEMRQSAADHTFGVGFPYQLSQEKPAFSVDDSSPHQSPRLSPTLSMRSPTRTTSPLPNMFPNEASIIRRDSNNSSQSNVHPLPRPPSAATPSQPTPVPATPILELVPIKGQWQKGKLIGRGTFGSVYVASNRETGALCAMKEVEILPDDPKSSECMKQLQQEIKVLSNLKHPNIVQYFGSEIVGDKFYIYLEYVHPGSITKFIHDHCGAITESVVRNFTRHILCGLAYLHGTKTIHRDIKGANLLVDAYGVVKLADFGMSKHLSGQAGHLSLKGSPYWMAPELLQSDIQDSESDHALAVDIWSLGCTIIEMMNRKPPWSEYEGPAAMFKVLRESPPIPDSLSPEGKDFLQCCFRRNPAERPTASMLLEHQFVKNLHQSCLPHGIQSLDVLKLKDNLKLKREGRR